MIITTQHLKAVPTWTAKEGYCNNTSRLFFKRYGLDWADFVANGIAEEKLLATGNALAIHLVEFARSQQASFSKDQLAAAVESIKDGR